MSQEHGRPVAIVGGGGHARSVADVAARRGFSVVAIVDPSSPSGWDVPVVARTGDLAGLGAQAATAGVLVAIGSNAVRAREHAEVDRRGLVHITLVASTATVGGVVGAGSQILEHAHVGPGATIGRGVIVNTGAIVEHDAVVGDFVHVAPGARLLGGVRVGAGSMVGSGAVVLPSVQIGLGAVVGAGSVVVRDVPAGAVVRGVPAHE